MSSNRYLVQIDSQGAVCASLLASLVNRLVGFEFLRNLDNSYWFSPQRLYSLDANADGTEVSKFRSSATEFVFICPEGYRIFIGDQIQL